MQRLIVLALILLLSHMPVAFAADSLLESAMGAAQQLGRSEAQPQRQVELLGVGAVVKVRLSNGQKLDGSLMSIDADSFDLVLHRGDVRRVTYGEVAELKFVSATYKASGPPNVAEVRRVAAGLGAGRHVAVKVTSGQTWRGHIQAVHEEHLVLLRDRTTTPIDVAYDEVQALGPNLSRTAKTVIWVGVD